MNIKVLAGAMSLCLVTVSAQATDFELGLNDETISLNLQADINKDVNASAEYFYSDKGGQMLSGAMHIAHDAGIHHIEIGGRFSQFWASRSPNGNVVSLGARYEVHLGSNISVHGAGYYSPSVLSFGHIDGAWDVDGKVQYQLNPAIAMFAGYRKIRLKYDYVADTTFDSSFYVGFKATF
ncbi:YfaZ family outer membrane protein [Shewanella youngdeokensis]|uniref:YfaZ family outer membrane protein n=1 Tax=Shewanella youngdeokensis TaxID=2999068 RepID=A0ABZ0K0L7_9GAMM|nr:YfaZ family outer membrane protein [Shewanella sp. DAU334]